MSIIGNKIKEIRTLKNMTQEELASKMNYKSRSTINKIELGIADVSSSKVKEFARVLGVSVSYLMGWNEQKKSGTKIPVLGSIPAGIPLEAIEEVLDYEEISEDLSSRGEYFALKVKGDSMSPVINDEDIVIIRKQDDAESGKICVVMINGFDATLKEIKKEPNGLWVLPKNAFSDFKPMFFTDEEVEKTPVRIIGVAVEIRRSL